MLNEIKEEYFYKKNPTDKIWWYKDPDVKGPLQISFDKKKLYNLWTDYPYNMTDEEVELFDKENPYWKDFFKDRKK